MIGDPVAHSLSPLIHNQAFRAAGLNCVYVPFRVPRADLATFLKEFNHVPVQGYSVTIPHKEAAAAAAKRQDDAVTDTQAANTLVRDPDGLHAYNTDYQGVLDALAAHFLGGRSSRPRRRRTPHGVMEAPKGRPLDFHGSSPLHDKAVLVLGAGGVARAVTHALHHDGALVTITNRTPERGLKLAEEVGCRNVDWAARHNVICDILVNCTSVGMHPNLDETPVHPSFLKPGLTVFDTVYTPETTLLVKEARDRGCYGRHRGGAVRAPGGVAVPAVHRPAGAAGADAQGGQAGAVAGDDPAGGGGGRVTRRQGDKETRRQGDKETARLRDSRSPDEGIQSVPPVSLSPCLLVSLSPVFLIGPRGSGKTTVARLLADRLGWDWLDADDVLEARHGQSVRDIFAEEGEAGFRDRESVVLADLCGRRQLRRRRPAAAWWCARPTAPCCGRRATSSG